jgi:hypothetical protein
MWGIAGELIVDIIHRAPADPVPEVCVAGEIARLAGVSCALAQPVLLCFIRQLVGAIWQRPVTASKGISRSVNIAFVIQLPSPIVKGIRPQEHPLSLLLVRQRAVTAFANIRACSDYPEQHKFFWFLKEFDGEREQIEFAGLPEETQPLRKRNSMLPLCRRRRQRKRKIGLVGKRETALLS